MTWFDYAVLAIIGISALLSIVHGFVRELLALASWIIAFLVAQLFAADLAPLLPAALPNASLRLLAVFVAVFLAVLLGMTLLAIAISRLVKSAGLGGVDRLVGAVFGLGRGGGGGGVWGGGVLGGGFDGIAKTGGVAAFGVHPAAGSAGQCDQGLATIRLFEAH